MSALTTSVADVLAGMGVDLEDLSVSAAGRRQVVRVVVDRDGGVDLDLIAEISRQVSDLLDRPDLAALVPGPFVLEVTSPGVDRPLTQPRHWRRNVGRLVEVTSTDGSVVVGRVLEADDVRAVLDTDGQAEDLPYTSVGRAVVQVEFTRDADEPAKGGA